MYIIYIYIYILGGLGIRGFAMLAPSAFLTSAAGTSCISLEILPERLRGILCPFRAKALFVWGHGNNVEACTFRFQYICPKGLGHSLCGSSLCFTNFSRRTTIERLFVYHYIGERSLEPG